MFIMIYDKNGWYGRNDGRGSSDEVEELEETGKIMPSKKSFGWNYYHCGKKGQMRCDCPKLHKEQMEVLK